MPGIDGKTFYKAIRSRDHEELLRRPNEYALLSLIAYRARRTNGFSVDNLRPGEALIGDYEACGLTRRKYRTALENLKKWGFLTIKPTNKGTIARLINSNIFDINPERCGHQTDHRPTIDRPSTDHRPATNKNVKNERNTAISVVPTPSTTFPDPDPEPPTTEKTTEPEKPRSNHYSAKLNGDLRERIKDAGLMLLTLCARQGVQFNPFAWVQKKIDAHGNPNAIVLCLERLVAKMKKETVANPWGYCDKIFEVENGNYNEADSIRAAAQFKTAVTLKPDLQKLIDGLA